MVEEYLGWRSSESDKSSYLNAVRQIIGDENCFNDFRGNTPAGYITILEHLSYADAVKYFELIKSDHGDEIFNLNEFSKNDICGARKFPFDTFNINPTTLRYSYVALEIKKLFSSFDNFDYIEIGGGYGGQARIAQSLFGFNYIKLLDLPDPLKLQKKFLSKFNITPETLLVTDEFEVKKNSLAVSNYAWCELDEKYRSMYLEKVISKCDCFYLTSYEIDIRKELSHISDVTFFSDKFNTCTVAVRDARNKDKK